MRELYNKQVGIWGYGITGAAAIAYCKERGAATIHLYDDGEIESATQKQLKKDGIIVYNNAQFTAFQHSIELLIPSAGIPPHKLAQVSCPMRSDFTLFAQEWKGTIVGISGSVGKTTVTLALAHHCACLPTPVVYGGNIGIPLLSLLSKNTPSTTAIIELSSFQLLQAALMPLHYGIITNITPNHLDYHGSWQAYREAKYRLFQGQHKEASIILPLQEAYHLEKLNRRGPSRYTWFSACAPTRQERDLTAPEDIFYYWQEQQIVREDQKSTTYLTQGSIVFPLLPLNTLVVHAQLHAMNMHVDMTMWDTFTPPPHRFHYLGSWDNIHFYNDSKSTVPASTYAAVEQLAGKEIILLLGGLSKGVNRKQFIEKLAPRVARVYCFGKEAEELAAWCAEYKIATSAHKTLESAVETYKQRDAKAHDHLLFSPAGSSYDLFGNYRERGDYFIKLVKTLWPEKTDAER